MLCGLALKKGWKLHADGRGLMRGDELIDNTERGILMKLLGKYVEPKDREVWLCIVNAEHGLMAIFALIAVNRDISWYLNKNIKWGREQMIKECKKGRHNWTTYRAYRKVKCINCGKKEIRKIRVEYGDLVFPWG